MALEIKHNDGRTTYDFTSASYNSVAECQAAYEAMVKKGNAGNVMFKAFQGVSQVIVTKGGM
jgi:hypothetical protein